MAEFSLLKLQFEDAEFTANAPFSGSDEAEVGSEEDEDEEESGSIVGLLLGLVFLVVLAIAVKKFLGGDSVPEPRPE